MLRFQFVNCTERPCSLLYTKPKLKFSRFGSWSDMVARQVNSVTAEHFHRGERLISVFPWQVWWLCLSCSGRRWHLTGVWMHRLFRTPKEGMSRCRQSYVAATPEYCQRHCVCGGVNICQWKGHCVGFRLRILPTTPEAWGKSLHLAALQFLHL